MKKIIFICLFALTVFSLSAETKWRRNFLGGMQLWAQNFISYGIAGQIGYEFNSTNIGIYGEAGIFSGWPYKLEFTIGAFSQIKLNNFPRFGIGFFSYINALPQMNDSGYGSDFYSLSFVRFHLNFEYKKLIIMPYINLYSDSKNSIPGYLTVGFGTLVGIRTNTRIKSK